MPQIILTESDNTLQIDGLKDTRDNSSIAGATISCTLYEDAASMAEVAGVTWPIVLPATGTSGQYRATLPAELVLVVNKGYHIRIAVDGGSGRRRVFQDSVVARAG